MPPNSSQGDVASRGRITKGLARDTLIDRTLEFVRRELPNWRDDPTRPHEEAEERLNAQLCKYLNATSRKKFPMVYFHHEEKQTTDRRVDMSALSVEPQAFGSTPYSIYDPFLVFEGKRLPPPKNGKRAREYVTGADSKCGGIQRFKLGLHGAKHDRAALVGYVQKGELREWLKMINGWIRDLEATFAFEETWRLDEQLSGFIEDTATRIAVCSSSHPRVGDAISKSIRIRHLWVKMKRR
jgi:hypothetical protein